MLIRVSINDLYLIQSIVSKSASESLDMTFAWLEYNNKKNELDEEARSKSGVIIKPVKKDNDQIRQISKQHVNYPFFELLIIDEKKEGHLVPLF